MTTVTERIEALTSELREAVAQYNQTIESQAVLREKIIATQGAIGVLQDLEKEKNETAIEE